MSSHLIDGEFQSDKYPTCPRGKVPLGVKDPTAQDLLWQYAQRRRAVDAEFSDDLELALLSAGYHPTKEHRPDGDEANRGDATSGVARSPSAGEPTVTEPDDYVKRLHEDMERESRLVVSLDLDTVEGLVEARRCVDKHCSDAGRDDKYHAKALRTLDRLLSRTAPKAGW